jgi:hypothetical protein
VVLSAWRNITRAHNFGRDGHSPLWSNQWLFRQYPSPYWIPMRRADCQPWT